MNTTNVASWLLMGILMGLSVVAISMNAGEQRPTDTEALRLLFDQAVSAEGVEYFLLRSNIVSYGSAAVPFLNEQTTSTNLHVRVLARAMLSWIAEPEKNQRRITLLADTLVYAARQRPAMIRTVSGPASGRRSPWHEHVHLHPNDNLHEGEVVAFLLEVTLKGVSPTSLPRPDWVIWARALAAGLAGWYKDSDVIPVLVEQLKSGPLEMRVCAVSGLRRTRSYAVVDVLLNALLDNEPEVRVLAYGGLMEITGQDFRKGVRKMSPLVTADQIDDDVRKQFQEWWQQNKERLLSNPEVQK